eukprot:TRINITY_DN6933_c0_g1_i1.p1 TRINITY_DN6933_c0_g1~~TRINITY_DN6933_c0_g1_i1.p1  ORF type:complete len:394 (+),score=46.87 TRINITY_DN6933_c0_g1_i1:92-1273(+)
MCFHPSSFTLLKSPPTSSPPLPKPFLSSSLLGSRHYPHLRLGFLSRQISENLNFPPDHAKELYLSLGLSPFLPFQLSCKRKSVQKDFFSHSVAKSSLSIPTRGNAPSQRARKRPRIIPLPPRLLTSLLPYSGTGEQVLRHLGGPATWLRRGVVSMAGSVLLYNVNVLLTVAAALYWAWSPIFLAASGNMGLRLKYKYAGLWRAVVLDISQVEHVMRTDKIMNDRGRLIARPITESKLRVIVGDDSGIRLELLVPVPATMPTIGRGEPAELLVLSDRRTLSRFNAVREVYLPERRLWFSEEPSIEHTIFEDVSREFAASRPSALDDDDDFEAKYKFLEDDQEVEQFRKSRIGIGTGGGAGEYGSLLDEHRDVMGSSWNSEYSDMSSVNDNVFKD